ncbi:MAG: penicillin-binding protein 1C [Hyphomicrobiales bacterium]|nr:penicillin-binding protein 1C [Hyphomicrobiales bacterium]
MRRAPLILLALAALVFAGVGGLYALDRAFPPPRVEAIETSATVVDRDGALLRPYAVADGLWRLPVVLDEIDPAFLAMLVAYEDKRFHAHRGVDMLALGRAALQMIRFGRIVSGGSTLTMQLARLLKPRAGRSLTVKLRQILTALQLERRLTKREILTAYLTLAPYGGNLEGVRSASLAYFGTEPRKLDPAQAALLVALPQAPEARRPDRDAAAAKTARDRVLARMAHAGVIDAAQAERAAARPLNALRRDFPALAAHAADAALAKTPSRSVRLTISRPWQAALEELAREHARALGAKLSVAVLVADHGTGEILARVGSADFFDEARAGQIDMTRALRSPGSTLKPAIYALAFEAGLVHPATLIEDRPADFTGYRPHNFDLSYQGSVSVSEALQMSLNVPAVMLLDAVGPARLMARLRRANAAPLLPRGEAPGLAIGLGGVGVTLEDLVSLYAAFPRGGRAVALTERADAPPQDSPANVVSATAAWYVSDILTGVPPPVHAAGGRIAYKTGTSYGYRDAWAIGFDGRHVIGVWVGRPDGSSVADFTGRNAAAPILFDAFARISPERAPLPPAPRDAVLATTAELPLPLRHFTPSDGRGRMMAAAPAPSIAYPPNGARVELGLEYGAAEPLVIKVQGGLAPFRWLANGVPLTMPARRRQILWTPDGKGFSTVTVIDAAGRADRVELYLD